MSRITERWLRWPPSLLHLVEWSRPGLPRWRSAPGLHDIRIEEHTADGAYVLRAELPGVDPDKDLEVSVMDGTLTLCADRRSGRAEQAPEHSHSEFRYGAFARAVRLPAGARAEGASAEYGRGVLTVTVPLPRTGTITASRG